MIFDGAVGVARAAAAGGEGGVVGKILPGGGARQHAQDRRRILQRRHQLLDRGQHDVDLWQCLRQVAIALVGDDDRSAGFGDEEVGAGDADIRREVLLPQHAARLLDERRNLGQIALRVEMGVDAAEVCLHLVARQVHGRCDDVGGPLIAQLDDVFAEVGFDRRDAIVGEMLVQVDLFRDHRLALGDHLRIGLAADFQHGGTGILGRFRPVYVAARLLHLGLVCFEVDVEVVEHVVLDVAGLVAQLIEFRQRLAGLAALGDEARARLGHGELQLVVGQRLADIVLEVGSPQIHHVASAMGGVS